MPGDPPRAFAKTIVDTLEKQVGGAIMSRRLIGALILLAAVYLSLA